MKFVPVKCVKVKYLAVCSLCNSCWYFYRSGGHSEILQNKFNMLSRYSACNFGTYDYPEIV